MSKDPAFLFYSQDFYAGTRDMLPEERACYIDLLIYQHQRGFIPKDLKRVLMFCSGVTEATLVATLEAKFKQSEEGWYNERLSEVVEERQNFKQNASQKGKLGAFFKLAKKQLKASKYKELRELVYDKIGTDTIIETLLNPKATLQATLDGLLKQLEDEDEDENNNKGRGQKLFKRPTLEEVVRYFKEKGYTEESAKRAWEYYEAGDWKDSQGNQVKSWKQKVIAVWFKDENKRKPVLDSWANKKRVR